MRRSFTACYLLYSCLVIKHTDAYEEYTQKQSFIPLSQNKIIRYGKCMNSNVHAKNKYTQANT